VTENCGVICANFNSSEKTLSDALYNPALSKLCASLILEATKLLFILGFLSN
jgi:hypothetical protein